MSYLDEHDEIQKNIEESRFSETAEYLVNHFEYSNSVARNQSETSKSKLSGALVGILSDDQYQQTFVKYDENENIVLFKNIDNDPNSIILDISDNKAIRIPAGTTAQRPTIVKDGLMRINTTTNYLEIYTNGNWGSLLKSDQAGAYIEGYVDTYIEDISRNINDRVTRDLSNVIGGASESLDTLLELENYVTDMSEGKIGKAITDILDISGRESQHYIILSNEIVDLSSETVRDITDLSSYTSSELSREISDLSSETVRDITDLSSYTSSELSREISDLSSETVRDIIDLSNSTTTQLNTKQDTLTNGDVTNNLLANSSFTLGGVNINLGDTDNTPAFDLTDATNYPTSSLTGTIDLTNQVAGILPVANGGTSWQTKTNGLRYDSNIGIGIDPTSTVGLHCKQDGSNFVFEGTNVNKDSIIELRNSSGNTTAWKLQNDAVNAPADSFRIMYYNGNALRIDNSTRNVNIGSSYNNTNPYKLNVEGTVNTEGKFTTTDICANDISANAMDLNNLNVDGIILNNVDINSTFQTISHVSIISQEIVDLSGYTSSELSREISDLSSETVRDITDLSSYTSSELSREISDLSSETVRDVTDLSSYTSSELSREISDLSSETVRDITDLSSCTSSELSREISDLSSETVRDVTDLSSYTSSELSREISDLSSETVRDINDLSSETVRDIIDLSSYTSSELSREISDLSSETVRDIIDLSSYTSSELSREISDLSSETVRDVTDLSSYTSSELSREISDLSSLAFYTVATDVTDLSSYTSSELSREISDLSSETVRDIIDLSSYTSNELTRQIVDLSNSTTTQLNIERNTTSTEISTVYSYTSSELHREITDLSSETVRDISDLSSLAFYTVAADVASIDTNISDSVSTLISHTLDKVSDLSNYTSTELSREISIERSTVVRDLSDMSGGIHHIIDDLIGNAPTYLDTLEEIAFVLGNPNDPSGGDLRTIIQKIYSVSQDIYDLSQTVAGVDSNFRILDGTLTVNTNLSEGETTAINAINGDISLNKTILFHNKGNIILGNASTGDTIKPLSYANMPLGNILIGSGTDISNSSIQYATGVGHSIDLSGTGSTALGYLAKTDGLNATAIGYNSVAFGDNVIQLGNTQVEYVNTNGVVTMSSDARLKANVKTIPNALEKVNALRGVTYTRTDLPNKDQVYMGLIAQETEKIIPEVVNNKGQYKSIMYSNLVGVLVEAVKDLDINHKILNGRQTTLETEITTIKDVIRTRLKKLNKIKNLIDVKDNKDKK